MKRDTHRASAALIVMATITLSVAMTGCGADDSATTTTPSATSSSSPGMTAKDATQQSAPAMRAAFAPDASAPFAADPAIASDPVAETMQANLAADNQQIAPVMHYAPGDSKSSN